MQAMLFILPCGNRGSNHCELSCLPSRAVTAMILGPTIPSLQRDVFAMIPAFSAFEEPLLGEHFHSHTEEIMLGSLPGPRVGSCY